jgi:uncharacterized membrane protein
MAIASELEARSPKHEAPLQIILGVFASPTRASDVRQTLREAERLDLISIVGMTLVRREEDGRLEFLESRTGCPQRSGSSLSAILRLMCGSTQQASSSVRLQELAEALPAGSSAIAGLIEHRWVDDVRALMEEAGADVLTQALKSEIAAVLAEGRDFVVTAGAADWRAGSLQRLSMRETPL